MHHDYMLLGIVSAVGALIRAGVDVGFVVVAFAVVRPRGLDGASLLAAGGCVRVASSILGVVQWPILNVIGSRFLEVENFTRVSMVASTFMGLVADAGTALVIAGVVSVARSAAPRVLSAAPGTLPGP